jgi:uncharacterized protein YndB with AHSA1/START domain
MGKEFEVVREFETDASPEEVWAAITTGASGWLWPTEYEPGEGGPVTVWDPPRRLTSREEFPEGAGPQLLNRLDQRIEPRAGGGSWVRYVHSGVFVDDWEDQYDGIGKHTDFYLHTLRQYLEHFTGRRAAFASLDAPAASAAPGALETVTRALGVPDQAAEGDTVRIEVPGTGPVDAVVDFRNTYFLGLRTGDAMYRIFGRNHFGAPVGVSVHDFAPGADPKRAEGAWQDRLAGLFA